MLADEKWLTWLYDSLSFLGREWFLQTGTEHCGTEPAVYMSTWNRTWKKSKELKRLKRRKRTAIHLTSSGISKKKLRNFSLVFESFLGILRHFVLDLSWLLLSNFFITAYIPHLYGARELKLVKTQIKTLLWNI